MPFGPITQRPSVDYSLWEAFKEMEPTAPVGGMKEESSSIESKKRQALWYTDVMKPYISSGIENTVVNGPALPIQAPKLEAPTPPEANAIIAKQNTLNELRQVFARMQDPKSEVFTLKCIYEAIVDQRRNQEMHSQVTHANIIESHKHLKTKQSLFFQILKELHDAAASEAASGWIGSLISGTLIVAFLGSVVFTVMTGGAAIPVVWTVVQGGLAIAGGVNTGVTGYFKYTTDDCKSNLLQVRHERERIHRHMETESNRASHIEDQNLQNTKLQKTMIEGRARAAREIWQ